MVWSAHIYKGAAALETRRSHLSCERNTLHRDGEKTLTATIEDALISPESFAILSGAGIVKGTKGNADVDGKKVYTHTTYDLVVEGTGKNLYAMLPQDVRDGDTLVVSKEAPIYATTLDSAGAPKHFLSAVGQAEIFTDKGLTTPVTVGDRGVINVAGNADLYFKVTSPNNDYDGSVKDTNWDVVPGDTVRLDCYTVHGAGAQELQIDAESFAGYYYIEMDTLFREEATGQDLPAQFIIPRGKIQSNFTFTMANSGDPSTFSFTIDCFPAYTKFNKMKKVLATLQIIDPTEAHHNYANKEIIGHDERTGDEDDYIKGLYNKSVFDQVEGNTEGGEGGNTDSGNTDGGNTDSGNTDSGNTDGETDEPTPVEFTVTSETASSYTFTSEQMPSGASLLSVTVGEGAEAETLTETDYTFEYPEITFTTPLAVGKKVKITYTV